MKAAHRLLVVAFVTIVVLAPAIAFLSASPRATLPNANMLILSRKCMFSSDRAGVPTTRHATAARPLTTMSAGTEEQKGLVTVYHKETCPYCKKALELLEEGYSLRVSRVNVLEGEDSEKKIKQMKTFSGRDTVPQIFFNSYHLGGNDDLQKLHEDGKLEALVAKVCQEAPGMMKPNWYHPWY